MWGYVGLALLIGTGIIGAITWALMRLAENFGELVDMVYPYASRTILTTLANWSGTVDFTLWQVLAVLRRRALEFCSTQSACC